MQIGMALSGGGIRAMVFHLGVLARMATENRLEDISFISTVSGGSLCVGLVFALNNCIWPSSSEFRGHIVSEIRNLLTSQNLERKLILKTLFTPKYLLHRRAKCLASLLENVWRINGKVCELPEHPRWVINAACHETGKRWRFERKRMGDYAFGEALPDFPLSEALAASAAVPFAIGSLVLDTTKHQWERYIGDEKRPITPDFKQLHLWDGALYDNLGTEAFAKRRDGYEFLIVSDASTTFKPKRWSWLTRYRRIYDISSSQSQSLRSRALVDKFIQDNSSGRYLKIGNTVEKIFREAKRHHEIESLHAKCLTQEDVVIAKDFNLTLRRLTDHEFDNLFRHGFEVADCTLYAYSDEQFKLMTFDGWSG